MWSKILTSGQEDTQTTGRQCYLQNSRSHFKNKLKYLHSNYYDQLHMQLNVEIRDQIGQSLAFLHLPTLTKNQNPTLITEITKPELNNAIRKLTTNRPQGPDGFSTKWYKMLQTFNIALNE